MENSNDQNTISKALLAVNFLVSVSIMGMIFLIYTVIHQPKNPSDTSNVVAESKAFNNISIVAKSAYVFDVLNNKVIYKKNEFAQLPLASITKLMTALTASEILPKNSHVTIKKEFLEEEGDSGLLTDESWKLKDLLDFSLVVSSNDGARSIASVAGAFDLKTEDYALGRKDFILKMNVEAKKLGLQQTYFVNESGLDEGNVSGGYGSALDVSKLLQYILMHKPNLLEATKYPKISINSGDTTHSATNTDIEVNNIPALIASKTGFTDLAGGNLAVAFDSSIGRPIIVVVLGSTAQARFSDVSTLVKASMNYTAE